MDGSTGVLGVIVTSHVGTVPSGGRVIADVLPVGVHTDVKARVMSQDCARGKLVQVKLFDTH